MHVFSPPPQSHWQREAPHHEFDAYGRALDAGKRAVLEEAAAAAKAQQPQAAPVYYDVTYDPQHPDADWSGLVRKRSIKKPVAVPSVRILCILAGVGSSSHSHHGLLHKQTHTRP